MNDLCAEIGYKSINHDGEQLCGDHIDIVEQGADSTVIVLAVTGQLNKARLPTHVPIDCEGTGLVKDSVVLAEQIRTLDKRRLRERIGTLKPEVMARVSEAVKISLGFSNGAN